MKKEYLLAAASVALAVALALGLIRWLAPQLLGARPSDQTLVRESTEVPPFYQNLFRLEDARSADILLNDPATLVRGHPFMSESATMGPQDALGFRNRAVPVTADVVAIGDSQTYGNNAALDETWPHQVAALLPDRKPVVYTMATGGWAAVQYLEMFAYAQRFRPRVVVVAFHSGNDALESFRVAYAIERWRGLRPDPKLSEADYPDIPFPPPETEHWKARFADGIETVFTPKLRLAANDPASPAVRAGYAIMEQVARQIGEWSATVGFRVVMTIIPTKELCYAPRVARAAPARPPEFDRLVAAEAANIDRLAGVMKGLKGIEYVDLVTPLQRACGGPEPLYPPNRSGHPLAAGYHVIAAALAPAIGRGLPPRPHGLVAARLPDGTDILYVVSERGAWRLGSPDVAIESGWKPGPIPAVPERDVATLPVLGVASRADPERLGPGR